MTDIVAPLTWRMNLDTDGFDLSASRAGQTLRRLQGSFDNSAAAAARTEVGMHKVGTSFRNVVVTLGALRFALMDMDDFLLSFPKSIAKVGGEFERTQALMKGLSKESDEALKKMEAVRNTMALMQFAKNAPFDIKTLSDAFVKLKSAGIDPASGSMQALVNSVAKFGGSPEQMQRASVAIQQMMGKGVVSMEELRQQLGEAVPNAMELMARGMGISMAELADKVSKGTVRSQSALALMFMQMEIDAAGAAEAMLKTMPGALSRMQTEYQLFQKTVGNQGFLSALTRGFNEITERLASPAGQEFAKSVGKTLNDVTEALILTGRWISNNTDLLINLGKIMVATYGGSKFAGMFNAWRDRLREVAEEQAKVNAAALRAAERDMAGMQRAANRHVRVIDQLERSKAAYSNRAEARRQRESKSINDAINREISNVERLEKRKQELQSRQASLQATANRKQLSAIEKAQKQVDETTSKKGAVDQKVETVIASADSGLDAKQKAGEIRRQAAIDKATNKEKTAAEQLSVLQERKESALAAQRDSNATRVARVREASAQREEQFQNKIRQSQERITQLEEKRARIAEQTRSSVVGRLDKEKRNSEAQLATVNAQLKAVDSGNLTQESKDTQLAEFRKLETEKRIAHEAELRRVGDIRAKRLLAEAGLKNELEKQAERKPRVRVLDGKMVRAPDPEADRASESIKGYRSSVDSLRALETAHLSNARVLGDEEKAAAKSGDAMSKRIVGMTAESTALKENAEAIKRKITGLEGELSAAKAASAQEILSNGTARERVTSINQQIDKQRQLGESYQGEISKLQQGVAEKERAINASVANTSSIEREIQAKQVAIQGYQDEVTKLRSASVEKGKYSATTIAKIEALQRESVALESNLLTQQKSLDAERQKQVVDNESVATTKRKIVEIENSITAGRNEEQGLRAQAAAVDQKRGKDDAHIQTIQKTIDAERQSLVALNSSIAGLDRKTKAMEAASNGARVAGTALKGFGMSLVAGVGWALAFEVAMQGVMWVFDQFTKKARQAEAATQALNRARLGLAVEGDPEKLEKEQGTKTEDLATKQSKLRNLGGTLSELRGSTAKKGSKEAIWNEAEIKRVEAQIKNISGEIAGIDSFLKEVPGRISSANENIASTKIDIEVGDKREAIVRKLDATFDAKEDAAFTLDNLKRQKAAQAAGDTVADKVLKDAALQRGIARAEVKLERFRVMKKAELDSFADRSPAERDKLQASLDAQESAFLEMVTNVKSERYQASAKDGKPKDGGKGDEAPTKSTFATFVAARSVEIAKDKADTENWAKDEITLADLQKKAKEVIEKMTTPDLKTGQMTLNNGGKPKSAGYAITPEQKTQASDLLVKNEVGDRIQALQKDITPDLENLKAEQDRFADVMNGDNLFKPSKKTKDMDALVEKLTKSRELLKGDAGAPLLKQLSVVLDEVDIAAIKAGTSAEHFAEIMSRMKTATAVQGVQEATIDLRKKTEAMKDESVINDRVRARAEVDLAVKTQWDILQNSLKGVQDNTKLTDEEFEKKQAALKQFADFSALMYSNLAMQSRTAGERMADEWADGMKAMEASTSKWMTDFVDQIFDGKLKLKDFMIGMAKDTAKIQFKQVLATEGGMGPILNDATAKLGDLFGLKSPTKSLTGMDRAYNAATGRMKVEVGDSFMGPPEAGANPAASQPQSIFVQAKNGFDRVISGLESSFASVKSSLTAMLDGMTKSLAAMFDQIGPQLTQLFRGMSLPSMDGIGSTLGSAAASVMSMFAFANGGIMTSGGALSLRKYANGGIANRPQLAMFGEGSQPEAYVPLPDGRTIPVTMSGGQGGPAAQQSAEAPVVNINVINQTGTQATAKMGNMKFDGRQMILDVVLTAASQPGAFRDNFKAAAK